jgi:geranylgeranyl diphosphate synthase type II
MGGGIPAERALEAVNVMALAAGSAGMVGGQYLDMQYTARADKTLDELKEMQANKTGALIRASCECGAVLAGASEDERAHAAEYGRKLGAAFQIVDDILDEVGDEAVLGKPVGSDAAQGKVTYPTLAGIEKSRELAEQAGAEALFELEAFNGDAAEFLRQLIQYVLKRAS